MSFANTFTMKEELGRGAYSIVYRCVKLSTKKEYAVKVVKTKNMKMRDLMKLESEARICRKLDHPNILHLHMVLKYPHERYFVFDLITCGFNNEKLDHPNIVRLHMVFKDPHEHYFVFDLITGGELFDDLVSREDNYTEYLAAKCCHQLLATFEYCHSQGVIHRDVKPENILLVSKEAKIIKVADFGLAVEVEGDELRWYGLAGTPSYIAPEVLEQRPYGKPVDLWAIGVVLYIMLVGYQPFFHNDSRKLNALIKTGDYEMTSAYWTNVSEEAKDLVSGLLCVVPHRRLTATRALTHQWFTAVRLLPRIHRQDTVDRLRKFNARRKFKALAHSTMLVNRFLTLKAREAAAREQSMATPTSSSSSSSTPSSAPSSGRARASRRTGRSVRR